MKARFKVVLMSVCVTCLLGGCASMFYPKADALERLQQGMSPEEVTQLLGKPDYRRFDHAMEEWEYEKLRGPLDGESTVVVVRFEAGRLVYMDSFKRSERMPKSVPHERPGR